MLYFGAHYDSRDVCGCAVHEEEHDAICLFKPLPCAQGCEAVIARGVHPLAAGVMVCWCDGGVLVVMLCWWCAGDGVLVWWCACDDVLTIVW